MRIYFERGNIEVRGEVDKNQSLFCDMDMNREESVTFLFEIGYIFKRGGLPLAKTTQNYLTELSFVIVAPPMIATAEGYRASTVFEYYRIPAMTTDIVKAADGPVFRENQEDGVGRNVVSIIRSNCLEATCVGKKMPSLEVSRHSSKRYNHLREDSSCFQFKEFFARVPSAR
jgi:hypothetical protein